MNSKKMTRIKDIYSGKPDARDEATLDSKNFLNSYVMPPNFDLDGLLKGDKCLISGYKGTGKTALLLFLADQFKQIDPATRNSFILFKSDFDNRKRDEWAKTMTVEREGFLTQPDFSAMWRWHLFQQIVEDNDAGETRLFEKDAAWKEFSSLVLSVLPASGKEKKSRWSLNSGKVVFGLPVLGGLVTPQMDVTISRETGEKQSFYDLIEDMTDAFLQLKRTDVPYYIFLDELEAFYGETEIFQRDLRLIRDLMLEAKNMNMLFYQADMAKTKIICAVRSEIISSINRFIESKEVNKVVDGFDCPLIWDYNTTASFKHPIMEILLKRIELTENLNGVTYASREELQSRWFPERIDQTDPVSYILNANWSKPRDIVRLINAAQDSLHFEDTAFTQAVLESSMPKYSRTSLAELREELRALYSARDIDDIFSCLTGFSDTFTLEQLREQIRDYYPHSVLATRTVDVLSDLYRLGVVGNLNIRLNRYRWQYRGDERIILNNEWCITVHRGLRKALSCIPYRKTASERIVVAEPTFVQGADPGLVGSEVVLEEICAAPYGIKGSFDGNVGTVSRRRLGDYPPVMFHGGTLRVRVLGLNPHGGSYELEPVEKEPIPNREFLLTKLRPTQNGGVRGSFTVGTWNNSGTVSQKRWNALRCGRPLEEIALRVRIVGRNPLGNSFALEPLEEGAVVDAPEQETLPEQEAVFAVPQTEPVAAVAEAAPGYEKAEGTLPEPDFAQEYIFEVCACTNNGGVRGVFGECGWNGTLSRKRLEGVERVRLLGKKIRVRIDRKNAVGDGYALAPQEPLQQD